MGELGRGGLAHHDRAGAQKIAHHQRILFRNVVSVDPASQGRGLAGCRREVLDGDRNAMERAKGFAFHDRLFCGPCPFQRLFGVGEAEAVERVVHLVDALKAVLHDLYRRYLPGGDARGEFAGGSIAEIKVRHGVDSSRCSIPTLHAPAPE